MDTQQSFLKKNGQKIFAVLAWVIIAGAVFLYKSSNGLSWAELFKQMWDVLASPIGPLIYIALYALRPILFFPASIITIAAGVLYGWVGVLWVVIGSNLSALVAYTIGRFLGDGLLENMDSEGVINRYATRMRENSFLTVLIMRLVYIPYDAVNYIAGIIKIDWKSFIAATALGCLPGTAMFTLFGASFGDLDSALNGEFELNPWLLVVSAVLFVGSLFLSKYAKKREGIE